MSENIKKLRKKLHLTQEQLAEICGVNRVTVSCWENGKYEPDRKSLEKLSVALNVSVDTLMSPQEQKSAPVSQATNGGDNVNVQFNSDNSHNSGTITQSVTTGDKGVSEHLPELPGNKYISLKKYNYSDVVKFGLSGAVEVGLLITDKENFAEIDAENPPFAVVQNESFNLGRFGLQNVKTAMFAPVHKIDEEGKFYLISYNGRTSLQRVIKIPPDGYVIENDDGKIEITGNYAKLGNFAVLGKIEYTLSKR